MSPLQDGRNIFCGSPDMATNARERSENKAPVLREPLATGGRWRTLTQVVINWMQTWLVHMRSPRALRKELGWVGFAVFQLLVGGTVLAALVHSLFVTKLLVELAAAAGDSEVTMAMGPHAIFLAMGYVVSIVVSLVGLFRRRLLRCAWALIFLPVYWLLLSIASWRALFQLARDPYRWEKTEHGLARTSRLAEHADRQR